MALYHRRDIQVDKSEQRPRRRPISHTSNGYANSGPLVITGYVLFLVYPMHLTNTRYSGAPYRKPTSSTKPQRITKDTSCQATNVLVIVPLQGLLTSMGIFDLHVHNMNSPRTPAGEKEEQRLLVVHRKMDRENLPCLLVTSLQLIYMNWRRICCNGLLLMKHGHLDSTRDLTQRGLIWFNAVVWCGWTISPLGT